MQEPPGRPLGGGDPLEKEMATHSRILAWEIPWREEPGGLHPWGQKESDIAEWLNSNNKNHLSHLPRKTAVCLFSAQPHNVVKPPRCFCPLCCPVTTRGALDTKIDLRVSPCHPSARQSAKISLVQEPTVNYVLGGILNYSHSVFSKAHLYP